MPFINAENAADLARKSWHARRQAKAAAEQAEQQKHEQKLLPQDDYIQRRIARVREQIEMLSDMLDQEEDPNKLDRLASAIDRLDEMERKHAGRPLPGSLKPSQPKSTQRRDLPDPTPIAPAAAPEQGKPGPGQTG
jgi:DNA repair ATPase RecN